MILVLPLLIHIDGQQIKVGIAAPKYVPFVGPQGTGVHLHVKVNGPQSHLGPDCKGLRETLLRPSMN